MYDFLLSEAWWMKTIITALIAAGTNIVESGECGNEVWYTLDSNGLLTITSHQNQNQTQYTIDAHAFNGRTDIKKIKIESGVTEIDDYAFVNVTNLENIELPSTLKIVGICV